MKAYINKFKKDGFVKVPTNKSFQIAMDSVKQEINNLIGDYHSEANSQNCRTTGRAIDQRLDIKLPKEIKNANDFYGKRYILDLTDFSEALLRIVEHEHILNIAKKMLDTENVVLHNGSLSGVYPGNTGNGDMYHSDTDNFCNSNKTLNLLDKDKFILNIMILFDDVTNYLAPMKIIKGSHEPYLHKKINNHVSNKLNYSNKFDNLIQSNWIYKELIEEFKLEEISYTGNYGDIAVMNSFALHKASENYTKDKVRRVMILNFGRKNDKEFIRKYPYKKSKLFLSKLKNKNIGELTYRKNSSFLFKSKWAIEAKVLLINKLIKKVFKKIREPQFILTRLSRIKFKIFLSYSYLMKNKRDYLNIGGGISFHHPNFFKFDVRDDILYDKSKGLVKFDLSKNKPMPFKNCSLSGIYTSHCLEHLTDKQVKFVLKESFRILKNKAELRIVLPDMKMMFDAFDKRDATYLEEFREKQSLRSNYLWGYDSWLRLMTRSFAGHIVDKFSDAELERMYKDLDRNQFINEILKYEEFTPSNRFIPNVHKSYWDYEKLKIILLDLGFTQVNLSKRHRSMNKIMRNRALFDNTAPKRSFYLEAIK